MNLPNFNSITLRNGFISALLRSGQRTFSYLRAVHIPGAMEESIRPASLRYAPKVNYQGGEG